jgi:hypothetical protein
MQIPLQAEIQTAQGKFLVRDQPHYKLITFSCFIRRVLFVHMIDKFKVKLCIELMTNSFQALAICD